MLNLPNSKKYTFICINGIFVVSLQRFLTFKSKKSLCYITFENTKQPNYSPI